MFSESSEHIKTVNTQLNQDDQPKKILSTYILYKAKFLYSVKIFAQHTWLAEEVSEQRLLRCTFVALTMQQWLPKLFPWFILKQFYDSFLTT